MAQRKFRLNALRALHKTLGDLIAESDATYSGALEPDDEPTAQDNPPEFPGKPAAMDSAVAVNARSLEAAIPDLGRLRAPSPLPRQHDLMK